MQATRVYEGETPEEIRGQAYARIATLQDLSKSFDTLRAQEDLRQVEIKQLQAVISALVKSDVP